MKIAVVGTGYVGLTTALLFAELGHDVLAIDVDEDKVEKINKGICPIYEPGAEEIRKISEMANIMYIRQKEPLGLGHAIMLAEKFVGNEPFVILLGDDIIINDEPATKTLMDIYTRTGDPVIGVIKVPLQETSKYGIVKPSSISNPPVYVVDDLVEKPKPEEAPSNLAIVGRYLLTPEIFTYLKNIKKGKGGEYQLTDALKLFSFSRRLLAVEVKGERLDIGSPKSWLEANIFMGKRMGLL